MHCLFLQPLSENVNIYNRISTTPVCMPEKHLHRVHLSHYNGLKTAQVFGNRRMNKEIYMYLWYKILCRSENKEISKGESTEMKL